VIFACDSRATRRGPRGVGGGRRGQLREHNEDAPALRRSFFQASASIRNPRLGSARRRTLISVRRSASTAGVGSLARRRSLHSGNGAGARQRVIGLCRRRAGAACDERRDASKALNAAEGSPRPSWWTRNASDQAATSASVAGLRRTPWVAMSGSQAWPVVMTAWSWRRIAPARTVWAWVGLSLLVSRVVRCR
jgi:hypothetical protein